ncbi:MAG: hypothetical protein NZ993_07500 [Bacteroidetes bacterium]|nr:hypothetical protein [Bacteroidota bacterium]
MLLFGPISPVQAQQVPPDSAKRAFPDTLQLALDSLWTLKPDPVMRASQEPRVASGAVRLQGNLHRGVLMGSGQDPVMSSALRVELSGELAPGLQIRGLLSDQSAPLLPEGAAQPLRQWDRVFLAVEGARLRLALGDIEAQMKPPLQVRQRRMQGLEFAYRDSLWRLQIAAGLERGRFCRQFLVVQPGVPGPYLLRGALGEQGIWIVPGSERVYWNGSLLERDRDYTLDYATAELRFTMRRLPRADTRVEVEFQYATEDRPRAIGGAEVELGTSGRGLRLGWMRETDHPEWIHAVRAEPVSAGDRPPSVRYVRADTLWNGRRISFWRPWSGQKADTLYAVRFRYVGAGLGSYERLVLPVNGIAYRWVGPGRGHYEVLEQAERLDRHRAFLELPSGPWGHLRLEGLFAPTSDQAAWGLSYRGSWRLGTLVPGRWSAELSHRPPEFGGLEEALPPDWGYRWGIWDRSVRVADTLRYGSGLYQVAAQSGFRIRWEAEADRAKGELAGLRNGPYFAALRAEAEAIPLGPVRLQGGWLQHRDRVRAAQLQGGWLGLEGSWDLGPGWTLWMQTRAEGRRALGSRPGAFREFESELGLRWTAFSAQPWSLSMYVRRLERPREVGSFPGWLQTGWRSELEELHVQLNPAPWRHSWGRGEMAHSYRLARDHAGESQSAFASEGLLTWWPSGAGLAQEREVRFRWFWGRTSQPVREELFLFVGPELGQYVWEDHNRDGQAQLDEFRPAVLPREGQYARVWVASDRRQIGLEGRGLLSWRWSEGSHWRYSGQLRMEHQAALSGRRRGLEHGLELSPWGLDGAMGLRHEWGYAQERTFLGEARKQSNRLLANGRLPVGGRWYAVAALEWTHERNRAESLPGRDIALWRWRAELSALAQLRPMQYVQVGGIGDQRRDRLSRSRVHAWGLEARAQRSLGPGPLQAELEMQVRRLGGRLARYGWAAFALTEGFTMGWNMRWVARLRWPLRPGLELWAEYNGQLSSGLPLRGWAHLQARMRF